MAPDFSRKLVYFYFGCVFALVGRYFPTENFEQGIRGLLLSFSCFTLIYSLGFIFLDQIKASKILKSILVGVSIIFVFPYKLLMLDQFYFYKNRPLYYPPSEEQKATLFSDLMKGQVDSEIPHKLLLFLLIFISVGVLTYFSRVFNRVSAFLWSIGISLQAWFNIGYASPHSWVPTYEKPLEEKFFWISNHFMNGMGVVNADEEFHGAITQLFQTGHLSHSLLIQRSFTYYIVSQFSYFISPFFVWILFNAIVWAISGILFNKLLLNLNFSQVTARSTTFLLLFNPYAVSVVGQSSGYMLSIFAPIWFLSLSLMVLKIPISQRRLTGFLAVIGGMMLIVYNQFPWFLACIISLILLQKISHTIGLRVILSSFGFYLAYNFVVTSILRIGIEPGLNKLMIEPLKVISEIVTSGDLKKIEYGLIYGLEKFVSSNAKVVYPHYFLVILILFFILSRFAKPAISQTLSIVGVFLSAGLALCVYFSIGGGWLQNVPRTLAPGMIASFLLFAYVHSITVRLAPRTTFGITLLLAIPSLLLNIRAIPGWEGIFYQIVNGGNL